MAVITSIPVFNSLWNPEAIAAPYDYYGCRIRVSWNSNKLQIPVAVPDAGGLAGEYNPDMLAVRKSCVIVKVAAPTGLRIVEWAAQRNGALPWVPNPDPDDANQSLAFADTQTTEPKLLSDGATHVYQAAGIYIYFLKKPIWVADSLNMGKSPTDQTPAAANVFSAYYFLHGLQNALQSLGG